MTTKLTFHYPWLALSLLLAGCMHYNPKPLDLPHYHEELTSRSPEDPRVSVYAEKLNRSSTKSAVKIEASDGLSLEEAEILALIFNPTLRVLRAEAQVPLKEAKEARRWANPSFSFDLEKIVENVQEPWVIGGLLNLTLPLSGHLKIEQELLLKESKSKILQLLGAERAVTVELKNQWLEWSLLKERYDLTVSYLAELARGKEQGEALVAIGEVFPTEARVFLIEEIKLREALLTIEERLKGAEYRLKELIGFIPTAPLTLVSEVTVLEESFKELRMNYPPSLLSALAEYEAAELNVKLQIRKQYPDVTVGGGWGVDEGDRRSLFSLNVPLPFIGGNRRAIAKALGEREVRRAGAEAIYLQLLEQIAQAENVAKMADARYEVISKELAPLVDQQLAEIRALASAGEHNVLLQLEAFRSAYETKLHLLDATLARGTARNQLRALREPVVELSSFSELLS